VFLVLLPLAFDCLLICAPFPQSLVLAGMHKFAGLG
jgi:hypothetical protein